MELGPFRSYTYKYRALVYFHLKNYDKALADIAKAVELKPEETSNLRWIPLQLVAQCPDRRFREGLFELAGKTIQVNQGASDASCRVDPYCTRARLHAAFGRRKEALADFDAARQLLPRWGDWIPSDAFTAGAYVTHYGLLPPEENRQDEAIPHLRRMLGPTDKVARSRLHWVSHWLPVVLRRSGSGPGVVFASDMPWVRSTSPGAPGFPVRDRDGGWFDGTTPIAGLPYSKGILTMAFPDQRPADVVLNVAGQHPMVLRADVGACDRGSVEFQVLVDGEVRHQTSVMRFGEIQPISVDLTGAKEVVLRVLHVGNEDRCDSAGWGYARFVEAGAEDPLEVPPAELRSATEANAALLLAEVHWQLDHKDLARRWYDKAAEWMDKNKSEDEELRGYRDGAAKLLQGNGTNQQPRRNPLTPK